MSRLSDKDRRIALLVILNVVLAATLGTVIGMYGITGKPCFCIPPLS